MQEQFAAQKARSSVETPASTSRKTPLVRTAIAVSAALLLANCSSQSSVSKVDPKLGVAPSPVRVSDGSDVPKGGGRAMVGRPYTIAGKTFVPRVEENYSREGLASWYGKTFHGRQTANGEIFDKYAVTAAHPTMPLPSYARVTNLSNNRSLIVRVNDRGPFHGNRIIDVSRTVAEALDFRDRGVSRVRVDYVGPASVDGSDDRTLISTLRTDGMLAQLPATGTSPVMVASAEPAAAERLVREPGPAAPAILTHASLAAAPQPAAATQSTAPLPPERPAELKLAAADIAPPAASTIGLRGVFYASASPMAGAIERGSPFKSLEPLNLASLRRHP